AVRADRGAHGDAAMANDLRGYEPDAPNVRIAVFLAEAEPLRKMRANDIAVEQRDLPTVLEETFGEHLGGGRFARATQAGEPHAHALAMARRIGSDQDLSRLGPREPAWYCACAG